MSDKEIKVGLIGFGTVGSGVVKVLLEKGDSLQQQTGKRIVLKRIADLDIITDRRLSFDPGILTTSAEEVIFDPEIEVVVELIGGYEPARTFILTALRGGKNVVTANKALLAKYWDDIFLTAQEYNAQIGFEASVGGGIPIISSLTSGLCANQITSIFGIINGTCNYILTRLAKEAGEFKAILSEAQKAGYAEADPSLDIEGGDTAHKLSVLSSLAFGQYVSYEEIYTEGITAITYRDILYAQELGYTIKLLGISKKIGNEIEVRVHPTMIPNHHLLAKVEGVYNAIYVEGDLTGPLIFYGQGAGKLPTASAVVSDIVSLIKARETRILNLEPQAQIKRMDETNSKYYIRFSVADQSGVLAAISQILAEYNISIASVIQKERGQTVPIVMLTHDAREGSLREALKRIDSLEIIKEKSLVVRVEDLR